MKLALVLSSVLAALLCTGIRANADAVITASSTSFGAVVGLDENFVTIRNGCGATETSAVPLGSVLLIRFDNQCAPHDVIAPSAGLARCGTARKHALKVFFRGLADPYIALSARIINGTAFVQALDDSANISGPESQLDSIQPISYCPDEAATKSYPDSYCYESKKWAVNWSAIPVFSNKVFTRGSSIYFEQAGPSLSLSLEQMRSAYQTALSLWAIALQQHKNELGPDVMKYVDDSTASGGNYRLFTPPQVIRMDCSANALAIVKWFSERAGAFPVKDKDYIAKAQLQGRTILLNANDNVFKSEKDYNKPLPVRDVNLVTVFVHELGHSFGLPDRYDVPAVMNPAYVVDHANELVTPTAADTIAFAKVLRASISGAAPGVFNAKDCAGLRRRWKKNTPPTSLKQSH